MAAFEVERQGWQEEASRAGRSQAEAASMQADHQALRARLSEAEQGIVKMQQHLVEASATEQRLHAQIKHSQAEVTGLRETLQSKTASHKVATKRCYVQHFWQTLLPTYTPEVLQMSFTSFSSK